MWRRKREAELSAELEIHIDLHHCRQHPRRHVSRRSAAPRAALPLGGLEQTKNAIANTDGLDRRRNSSGRQVRDQNARQEPRPHPYCRAEPGAGDRRHGRHLQRRQRCAASSACRSPIQAASCTSPRRRCCGTISKRSAVGARRSSLLPNIQRAPGISTRARASSASPPSSPIAGCSTCWAPGRWPAGRFEPTTSSSPSSASRCGASVSGATRMRSARHITLDEQSFTIVGVMPEAFQFPYGAASVLRGAMAEARVDVWIAEHRPLRNRLSRLVARLKPGRDG